MKDIALLFDLDGVIIDTEPQYSRFWKQTAEKYHLGIPRFEQIIKGTVLPHIIAGYFSHLPEEEQKQIEADNRAFDLQMDIEPIPGAIELLRKAKELHIKTGLVTSSDDKKLRHVFSQLTLEQYFNTIVSADRITEGKPHPMCYLLAAEDLNTEPERCIVFEDSYNGIKSGNAAGMKEVGLYTTNPKESIENDCIEVIPNFLAYDLQVLISQQNDIICK